MPICAVPYGRPFALGLFSFVSAPQEPEPDEWKMARMSEAYCPRLSEAGELLPLLRTHIFVAASHNPRAAGRLLDLIPILDDGMFGCELISAGDTDTCFTLGCKFNRRPVVREVCYRVPPSALRLATLDGQTLVNRDLRFQLRQRQRDREFPDWSTAAAFALTTIGAMFPDEKPCPPLIAPGPLRSLESALNFANVRLARWDPFIHFFGLPNEAQLGYGLQGAGDECGQLVYRNADTWALRWKSADAAIDENWSLIPPDLQPAGRAALA